MIEVSDNFSRMSDKIFGKEILANVTQATFEGEDRFGMDVGRMRTSRMDRRDGFCETESRNRTPIIDRC